jgi:hypothetical protein
LFNDLKKQGEKVIDELIDTKKSEELFLDFKRSANNGGGKSLHQDDRNNLAKAISGFGNSEGGLILWGLECKKGADGSDLPNEKYQLVDAKKFVSQLEGAVSGLTLPPHSRVENVAIVTNKSGKGYAGTYIPQNLTSPTQSVYNKHFYIRAGSNFEPAPYQVLAGMFGKQPRPYVYNMYTIGSAELKGNTIQIRAGFLLHNEGPGIAKNLFINAKIWSSPGENCQIGFETPDLNSWTGGFNFGRFMSLISKDELRVPPDAQDQPLILEATFTPPFDKDFHIKVSCGCEGSPTISSALKTTKEQISKVYKEYVESSKKWEGEDGHKIAKELLQRENID